MHNDPTGGMTDTAKNLYNQVINDWSGRELRQVIAAADASDDDKQTVEQALYAQ